MRARWRAAAAALVLPAGVLVGSVTTATAAGADPTGSISGIIRAQTSRAPLAGAYVGAFEYGNPSPDARATTAPDGSYRIDGLAAGSYFVCALGPSDPSGLGYQGRCFGNRTWIPDPFNPPPLDAKQVSVTAGENTGPVSVALLPAAGIAGRVTDPDGNPVAGVTVIVFHGATSNGRDVASTTTSANGTYRISPLPPIGSGYYVCFDASNAINRPATGYVNQCYRNLTWIPDFGEFPDGIAAVPARAGQLSSGINATLRIAATLTGQVVDARDGNPIAGIVVSTADFTRQDVTTDASGRYTFTGLDPADRTLHICFRDGSYTEHPFSPTGYASSCHGGAPWDGEPPAPAGATRIVLRTGSTTTVNAQLQLGGRIIGTVTDSAGQPFDSAVSIYRTDGTWLGAAFTDTSGRYSLSALALGLPYVVCASASGAAAQCWRQIPWNAGDVPPPGVTRLGFAAGQTRTLPFQLAMPR